MDIFELNDVLRPIDDSITTMQYDHTTPAETILDVMKTLNSRYEEEVWNIDNGNPPAITGCQFIADTETDDANFYLPDGIQAIGLTFLKSFLNYKKFDGSTPDVYFVKRSTLLRMICDPDLYDHAVAFIVDNFKYIYGCNDGDSSQTLCSKRNPNLLSSPTFIDKSQWHCLLDFYIKLGTEHDVHIYPPVTTIRQFDDKLTMKKMLGDLALPFSTLTLPINVKGQGWWLGLTWTELYEYLIGTFSFGNITKKELKGVVLKPRFGTNGIKVVILEKKICDGSHNDGTDPLYFVVARLADKQLPDTPNEWFDWVNTSEKFLIEPYCPELETMEYRILYNVPKDSSSIFPIAHTQANTDFANHTLSLTSLSEGIDCEKLRQLKCKSLHPSLFHCLTKHPYGRNVNGAKGLVYRVDIFEHNDYSESIPTKKDRKWMINEMHLVPIDLSFVVNYFIQEPILNKIADAYVDYVYINYRPYYPV